MTDQTEHPVLIIGAGPVGQLAALLLSKQGVRSRLIDRRTTTLSAPKAHAVNARTLEICESVGVSAARLRELGASANDAGEVRFVGTLTGPDFGCLPYERQDDEAFADTPFPLTNIPQPVFEEELLAKIGGDDRITFQRGIECTSLTDDGSGVTTSLRDIQSDETTDRRFEYVIAADGAGSRTRDALGIAMEGPETLQDFLMIHFTADLRKFTEGRRGVLYFLFAPGIGGTLIAYDQAKTWVLMHPFRKGEEDLADYTDERCRELIARAVGAPVPEAVIENLSPWTMTAQIAEHYRKGRTFLVGDAAHRFPPTGGLGLNTGAGDAQNICWKLAAVLNDQAGSALLDTYEDERKPIARINSEKSLVNSAKLFDLIAAIHGPDRDAVAEHYAAVVENPNAYPELAAAVVAQKPHFDSFALQLGYRYSSDAIQEPAPVPEITEVWDYQPSWDAGAHFPHRWVTADGKQEPLQNFLPANRFSLLCGPAAVVSDEHCFNEVHVGADFSLDEDWSTMTGLPDDGALLIRPDGHIAARLEHLAESDVKTITSNLLSAEG